MAETTPATSFVISPKGPYSLAASIRYLEGFAPAAYDAESAASLEMAFGVDGYWDPVAVRVHEETGAVHGTVHGGDTLAPAVIETAVEQVERILSLDIDGRGFPDIARRDPVVAQLQSRYPGLRPVCFWSPYEAAAWSVIGQRIRIVQAAAIKARITAEHGETIDVGGRTVRASPNPAKLAQLSTINGLSETKLQRLRGVAEAALGGTLGAARLRSLPRSQALEEVLIGGLPESARSRPNYLFRGAGHPDYTPTAEPRFLASSDGDRLSHEGTAQRRRHRRDQRGLEASTARGSRCSSASCSKTRPMKLQDKPSPKRQDYDPVP